MSLTLDQVKILIGEMALFQKEQQLAIEHLGQRAAQQEKELADLKAKENPPAPSK